LYTYADTPATLTCAERCPFFVRQVREAVAGLQKSADTDSEFKVSVWKPLHACIKRPLL